MREDNAASNQAPDARCTYVAAFGRGNNINARKPGCQLPMLQSEHSSEPARIRWTAVAANGVV
jgi:hypothetical protein